MQLRSLAHLFSALGRLALSGSASAVKAQRSYLTEAKTVSEAPSKPLAEMEGVRSHAELAGLHLTPSGAEMIGVMLQEQLTPVSLARSVSDGGP
jgi:hypothetical protein